MTEKYPKARDSFFGHIGIAYYRYQLPQKVQDKINIADDYVKNEIINRFKKLEIENLPLIVAVDASGGDIFISGREKRA